MTDTTDTDTDTDTTDTTDSCDSCDSCRAVLVDGRCDACDEHAWNAYIREAANYAAVLAAEED